MKDPKNVKRGRRARQRGAELQRQAVRMAKDAGLEAYNRDRGGAQHEQGDIEIEGHYYGCKRRTRIAQWLKPEKEEEERVCSIMATCWTQIERDNPHLVRWTERNLNQRTMKK